MANYTEELNTTFNFPHIDIFNRLKDGVITGYQARTQEGYVMYDTTATDTEPQIDPETGDYFLDPETGIPIEFPTIYYYRLRGFPASYNFNNFSMVAVPEDSVAADHIFGVGDNNHEVM